MSKGGKVFTIFSTSKDHNQGKEAMAGCILVDFENLQIINRSHAYRNVYVHQRDSLSIAKLTKGEIEERVRLGLITENATEDSDDEEEYEESEEWEDMLTEDQSESEEENSDEENYTFSTRRSSVIPENTMSSPPGSHENSRWSGFDFSKVETDRSKRECQRLSVLTSTIAEDQEENDEHLDREDTMDFDDEKKNTY